MRITYSLFFALMFCLSCTGSEEDTIMSEGEYLVFGIYHNFCIGDCWHLFKIEGGKLYRDNFDHPRNGQISFMASAMPAESLAIALPLLEVPSPVVESDADVYGCPDCADQGGYYLEFELDGVRRVVNFDTWFDNFEEQVIIDYLNQMDGIIRTLQE